MSRANTPPIPDGIFRLFRAKTRPHAIHKHNPAGTKLLKKWIRRKYGKRVAKVMNAKQMRQAYNLLRA